MGRMYQDITAIILSGGKSTRMGENKSFLKIGDITVIEHIVELLKSIFSDIIIITNEPELYEFLNVRLFSDIYKNAGPLAGIHSGLINSASEKNFIISCDIPLMTAEMIKSIVDYPSDKLITIPKADGFVQELCGIYSKSLIPVIEKIISDVQSVESRNSEQTKRQCKIHQLINSIPVTIIEKPEILSGYKENLFLNMNNPDDYELIKGMLQVNNSGVV
ncbi:MAG: molybdenum cofactor guanylyltransferase [Candidatus Kapabacteria bacterium]|nr:molybdenum cofactor guanylyltransferase [Candidatus Kapabacteria bacterium]